MKLLTAKLRTDGLRPVCFSVIILLTKARYRTKDVMKRKAVFFDIDGTLRNWEHTVPDDTVRAVRELRAGGHLAFINSGRSQAFISEPRLLSMGWDGFVSGCGTYVQVGQRVVRDRLIAPAELARAVSLAREHSVRIILEGRFCLYFDDDQFADDKYGRMLIRELGSRRKTISDNYMRWRSGKFSVDMDDPAEGEKWLAIMSEKYSCIRHNETVVELVPRGFGKADGMLEVCSFLGIDPADCVVFGDGNNDLDMFRAAGTAVAMEDAPESVKDSADLVTSGPLDGGIDRALRRLGLI